MAGIRVAVASAMFEANTFVPGVTTFSAFEEGIFVEGTEVLTVGGGNDSIAGAIRIAEAYEAELVPTTTTIANPLSGPILNAEAHHRVRDRLLHGLAPLKGQVDGVYLQLHGAMVCEGEPDAEGDLLSAVRDLMGVPVSASLDLHTHFTDRMAEATPLLSGYHTLPHVDLASTGERAMRLLLARINGASPTIGWVHIPMLTSAEGQDTNVFPMREVMARVVELCEEPGVLDASIFMTQPWLDIPGLGWTAVVITDGDVARARLLAEELGGLAWEQRANIVAPKVAIGTAMELAASAMVPESGPYVFSDGADSVSAGSSGDGTELLAALRNVDLGGRAQVIVTDAAAAAQCVAAGVDKVVSLRVGGSIATAFHEPVDIVGTVVKVTDGRFESRFPPGPVYAGPTAVVRVGASLFVVVTTNPVCQLDFELYLHVGLDPRAAHVVVTKSAGGYKSFYMPFARACVDVATSGPCDSRIEQLPFKRIDRPLYPFDPSMVWHPSGTGNPAANDRDRIGSSSKT